MPTSSDDDLRIFRRINLDRYEVALPGDIRELLVWLASQLDDLLDLDVEESTRLFPTAYPENPEMDAGYQILARGQLIDQRRSAVETLKATAEAEHLTESEIDDWMRVINDVRLVIGTRLDVGEDDESVAEDDPDGPLREIYHLLGYLLSEIVDSLTQNLPPDDEDLIL